MGRFIVIRDLVDSCNTNKDGLIIKKKVMEFDGDNVILSFKNIDSITSSFVNSLFVDLMFEKGLEYIKSHVKIIDSNTQINRLIKERLVFEKKKELVK